MNLTWIFSTRRVGVANGQKGPRITQIEDVSKAVFLEFPGQLKERRRDAENAEATQRVEVSLRAKAARCDLRNLWMVLMEESDESV